MRHVFGVRWLDTALNCVSSRITRIRGLKQKRRQAGALQKYGVRQLDAAFEFGVRWLDTTLDRKQYEPRSTRKCR